MAPRICTEVPFDEEFPCDEQSAFLVGMSKLRLEEDDSDDGKPQRPAPSVYWEPGTVIRVRFLGGTRSVHSEVQRYAKEWEEYANIRFEFVSQEPSDIRISFDPDIGSHSYVGTEALDVSRSKATMNLDLNSSTRSKTVKSTVLHEFGHVLGLGHEHCSPAAGINWDKKAVYKFYKEQGWSKEKTKANVLTRFRKTVTQFSEFDPDSIMLYPISSKHTADGFRVGWNRHLSETDKKFIAKIYPMSRGNSGHTFGQGPAYYRAAAASERRSSSNEDSLDSFVPWRNRDQHSFTTQAYFAPSMPQQFAPDVQPQRFAPYSHRARCGVYIPVGLSMNEYYHERRS